MSMSACRRRALSSWSQPASSSLHMESLLSLLEARLVLPTHRVQEIMGGRTTDERMRLLVKEVSRRGDNALDQLFLALVHSHQGRLADPLRQFVSPEVIASLENELEVGMASISTKEDTVSQSVMGDQQQRGVVLDDKGGKASDGPMVEREDFTIYENNRQHVYPNFSQPRGHVLIISNVHFGNMPERKGSDADREAFISVFKSFGYTIHVEDNLTTKQMHMSIASFARDAMHSSTSSAVLCILSHGVEDAVHGTDDGELPVHAILSSFTASNAPFLAGKPKFIVIQACRGERRDRGFDIPDSGRPLSLWGCIRGGGEGPLTRSRAPEEADILVAFSTPLHYVSWRNSLKGSWFIQALCEVFRRHAAEMDVQAMLTLVNHKVARECEAGSDRCKQIPEQLSRLTKKFYLFPLSNVK